jgi:hypothetical protein
VLEQIDLRRVPVLLLLLGAGMFLATLLVRPGPWGSEQLATERRARRRRSFALRGMCALTLVGLSSGLAGGLLESAAGPSTLVLVLHALYAVCWLPAYLMRELQLGLSQLGVAAFASAVPEALGLLLIPVFWFLVSFAASGWLWRRSAAR